MPEATTEAAKSAATREHPMHRAQRERDEARAEVARLTQALAEATASSATETVAGAVAPATVAAGQPVPPEVFFMHLVCGIGAQKDMSALNVDGLGGIISSAAFLYDVYGQLVRDHRAVLAKAQESIRLRKAQDDEIARLEQQKRDQRVAHRQMLATAKGPATVRRLVDRGHSPAEAAALAGLQGGLPIPEPNV